MVTYRPYELHTHTLHSDGQLTPRQLAEVCQQDGLSGFALTDHNTVSGVPEAKQAGAALGLDVIGGVEWTTFYGHLTLLGGAYEQRAGDWREARPDCIEGLLQAAAQQGSAVGVAHPFRIGYPICTGGSDEWGMKRYGGCTHYEVFSYPSPQKNPTNAAALAHYRTLCARGVRLAAVYGRDLHVRGKGAYGVTFVGCEGDGEGAVLDALRAGRTYLSTGVCLQASVRQPQASATFGGVLPRGESEFHYNVSPWRQAYTDAFGVDVQSVVLMGSALKQTITLEGLTGSVAFDAAPGYCMACVLGKIEGQSGILALGTPYYFI